MEQDFIQFRDAILTVAKDSLIKLDALSPFAVVLAADSNSVSFIEAEEVSNDAQTDVPALQDWLREQVATGSYRAVALIAPCEVTIGESETTTQALYANVEYHTGIAIDVFVPFVRNKTFEFQEPIYNDRPAMFFQASE